MIKVEFAGVSGRPVDTDEIFVDLIDSLVDGV